MSYKLPQKTNKRAIAFYPNTLKVYEYANPLTGKMEPVFKNTPPYNKEVQGKTKREVDSYLGHLVEAYQEQRDSYVESKLKEAKNEVLKS